MPLTKTELLIPRVLCIGGKEGEPNDTSGEFVTGKILTVGTIVQFGLQVFAASEQLLTEMCTKFPHLFKPLPWWYGRTVEEMPEYVYYTSMSGVKEVRKLIYWEFFEGHWMWKSECGEVGNFFYYKDDEQYQPADESEYQEYQNRKINQ